MGHYWREEIDHELYDAAQEANGQGFAIGR